MVPTPEFMPFPPLMRMNDPIPMYGKIGPMILAHAYVLMQPYENFFPLEEALKRGTIFRSLYEAYTLPKHAE